MQSASLIQFLSHGSFISLALAETIAGSFRRKKFRKHDFVLKEGQISDEYIFLASGYMRSFAHDTEGADISTGFHSPGQAVFEVSSFFNRTPSRENIQALSDAECDYITFAELNHLFHTLPEFREFGRSVLVRGYSALKVRTLGMITSTAEERYQQLMKENPDIFQHAQLKQIASYLGITDTSLSRIRSQVFKQK